ncbi:hypothetical protein MLD38_021895 [Melastoma candidum]|uniref:Uncharacterized protein n=1 Tax=Melastoma candidum TaxID=119954 RepID=A0ACB9QKG6_9MYRT|nr:hypothetical protein MLD38_021895 [Melastoma candidum]
MALGILRNPSLTYKLELVHSKIIYFFNDLHSYLADCGVDRVKVYVQNVLETLGNGNGGRVPLTRVYQKVLELFIKNNFKNNNIICSTCHNMDSIYSLQAEHHCRASEDFKPKVPTLQTLHIASVDYDSLFLGKAVVPACLFFIWDDRVNDEDYGCEHFLCRARTTCRVSCSSETNWRHDSKILKGMVLPGGSILRAKFAGRPTRDCLFLDPVSDGKSFLLSTLGKPKSTTTEAELLFSYVCEFLQPPKYPNNLSGAIGVSNCRGSRTWPSKERGAEKPI